MKQSAAERPDPTLQRKAAIVQGGVADHAGAVSIEQIPDFDLNRTIFQTLEGAIPRFVMKSRIAKEIHWKDARAVEIQAQYETARSEVELPKVSEPLLRFLVDECDFDVEHAEGSFLDHLYFGFEYCVAHYPEQSPIVMLLHSILGTGTNTFAMEAHKIPALQDLITEFEFHHVEAFPSILRLLYDGALRDELRANAHRPDALKEIRFHRVIDNAPITMSGADLWIQLNYQLIHVLDFLPVANWVTHGSETSFVLFRDLFDLLEAAGKRDAHVAYEPAKGERKLVGETLDLPSRLVTLIPDKLSERTAARSIRNFSDRAGHSLDFTIDWA
ncbi:MAG: hypothetical protein ACJAYU_001936 [Bradymonadia bacterium]|jgi:hypothetical protein